MGKRGFTATTKKPTSQSREASPGPQDHQPFDFTDSWKLVRPAFELYKRHAVTASLVFSVPALLMYLGKLFIDDKSFSIGWALSGIPMIFTGFIWLVPNISASYYFQLRVIGGGKKPGISEIYRNSIRFLPRLAGLYLMITLAIAGGLILLVVPGAKALRKYFFAPYFLVDEDSGIRQAMQRSAKTSETAKGTIWGTVGVLVALGGIAYGVSALVPKYGPAIAALLAATYLLIPALRYKEVALRTSALAVKD